MTITELQQGSIKFDCLQPFGFVLIEEAYYYRQVLADTELELKLIITTNGEITAEVIDQQTKEPYVLHQTVSAQGGFVGKVRSEYEAVLAHLEKTCFEQRIFSQFQTQEIMDFVAQHYGDSLEFLWKHTPKNGIYRRADNQKWYAALLTVKQSKLGILQEGDVEVIDLRGEPDELIHLIDHQMYFPGYHMNKKHWFTICLDGSVPTEEIIKRIHKSYQLADK